MAETGKDARLAAVRGGQTRILDRKITRCPHCDQRVLPARWMTTPHEDVCPGLVMARA